MTFTDYVIDIALIAIVVLQVRGRRLTTRNLLLPLAIVVWAAVPFVKSVPTAGNDLVLVAIGTVSGAVLGGLCAAFTSVARDKQGNVIAKAGAAAAGLWVLGVGARFAFQLYATHGGGPAIGRFSAAHAITGAAPWTDALVLMALAEVVMRTAGLALRTYRLIGSPLPRAASGMIGAGDR